MGFNYSPKIVTDGLVLYLDAANSRSYPGSGTTWNDLSRNELVGAQSGSTFPTYNTGNGGNLVFNNTPINLGNSSVLNLTNLTLSVWYRSTSSVNQILIGKSYTTSYYLNVGFNISAFSLWTNNTFLESPTLTTLNNGNWHNISATMSGTTKTLYYDGVQIITGTGTVPAVDNFNVIIGNSGNPNSNAPFVGSLGNVIIYNRALSATEITQNYNSQKSRFGLA
jgi:hypothetical protein